MSLSDLIRGKSERARFATAIPAISATQPKAEAATVARIATVAVASPKVEKTAPPPFAPLAKPVAATVGADDIAACPGGGQFRGTLERAGEPAPTIRRPLEPLTDDEERTILAWLAHIGETDPAAIAGVIAKCQRDTGARGYVIGRAAVDLPKPDPFPDNRRTCGQCANLIARRCQAARRGEIMASRDYEPIRDLPRRCEGYAPGPDDPDRRTGRDRWPGLTQEAGG